MSETPRAVEETEMTSDRQARDRVVNQLKAKIREDKALLQERVDDMSFEEESRPYRARRLSEVFQKMGF